MVILVVFKNSCHRKYSIIYNFACDFWHIHTNLVPNIHFESPEIQGICLYYLFKLVANEMHDLPNIDDCGCAVDLARPMLCLEPH